MRNIMWWILFFVVTKAIAIETYICKWRDDDYECKMIKDDAEEETEAPKIDFDWRDL